MQHPVGYKIVDGKAQLTSVWALLSNHFALTAWLHTILAGLIFGSMVMLGVSLLALPARAQRRALPPGREAGADRRGAGDAAPAVVGNRFGEAVTSAQGMKIAASEAQWNTCQPCGFSVFQIGGFTRGRPDPSFSITIPRLLSCMATGSFNGEVAGPQPAAGPGAEAVRPRQLHAARPGDVLVDAGDGDARAC